MPFGTDEKDQRARHLITPAGPAGSQSRGWRSPPGHAGLRPGIASREQESNSGSAEHTGRPADDLSATGA